jgi:hypothetical protein
MILETFLKHFVLSGSIVALSAVLVEQNEHKLSGFLYGGLPVGFLYLLIVANQSREKIIEFSKATYIGGIYFLFYTFLIYLLFYKTDLSVPLCVLITTISFLAIIFATRRKLQKV